MGRKGEWSLWFCSSLASYFGLWSLSAGCGGSWLEELCVELMGLMVGRVEMVWMVW